MSPTTLLVIALALAVSVQGTLGNNFKCIDLNVNTCAFAVESSGKRCVLEKTMIGNKYTCATSEIVADNQKDLIETEECVNACGVDRKTLGISSDFLFDHTFIGSLCSDACYHNCSNIIDLYFNAAAGEGVYLPKLCEAQKFNGRREMTELPAGGSPSRTASAPFVAKSIVVSKVWAPAPSTSH